MRITPEYFVKIIDTSVGRSITNIITKDISNYRKLVELINFLDYEFEILPRTTESSDKPQKEVRTYVFIDEGSFLFQFSYINIDIDIRLTFGHIDEYCYLYNGEPSRYFSKKEIDKIEGDISYHLLSSSNFFDIDEEELEKIFRVKTK